MATKTRDNNEDDNNEAITLEPVAKNEDEDKTKIKKAE
jgi:hypothetical protein